MLGAGVAGLQAIATARRLGAVVEAYDVRPASADEVRSMGATFVDLDLEALEGAGGYAREMAEDRAARQRELLAPYVAAADVLITTAAVPGRPAPLLVTTDDGRGDAARVGGRRPRRRERRQLSRLVAGEDVVVRRRGRSCSGHADAASAMPVHASQLYATNVVNLLLLMTADGERGRRTSTTRSSRGACVTHDGEVRHEPTASSAAGRDA